jgi:hypothetical protein
MENSPNLVTLPDINKQVDLSAPGMLNDGKSCSGLWIATKFSASNDNQFFKTFVFGFYWPGLYRSRLPPLFGIQNKCPVWQWRAERVARCYIFHTKNPDLGIFGNGKMFVTFYVHLEYFMPTWNILRPFGLLN